VTVSSEDCLTCLGRNGISEEATLGEVSPLPDFQLEGPVAPAVEGMDAALSSGGVWTT